MAFRSRSKMGVEVLRFQGDLDTSEMIRMKNRLARLLARKHRKLLLDLRRARRVDLAGLGILVDRLRRVREAKGDIKLCNLQPEVEKAFQIIGVSGLMESFRTEEEALRSFAA